MEKSKTHWKKLTNPNYIGSYAIDEGKELTVTITKVVREKVKGTDGKEEECTVAYLEGQKPMILNSTNSKQISKIYGTPYIEDWVGKSITLYVAKVRAFGDVVDAIRIKSAIPNTKLPGLKRDSAEWVKAREYLTGGGSLAKILTKYSLSEDDKDVLVEESI